MENQKADLNKLAKSWKSPFVARGSIREFSGGLIHPRTLANMDSKGIGPDGKFRMGRQVGYPVEAVIINGGEIVRRVAVEKCKS